MLQMLLLIEFEIESFKILDQTEMVSMEMVEYVK